MDARAESGAALPGTPVSNSSPAADASAGMVLNNGPGVVVTKGPANGSGGTPSTSGTVIIQASAATGATLTVVRPAMQTAALAVNGSNVNSTAALNVAPQQAPAAAPATGVTLTLTPQTSGQAVAPGALTTKPDPAKSIIQSAAGHTATVALTQQLQPQLHVSPGPAKGAVLQQGVARSAAPAPSPAGVRAIAPQQVLAPRLPQSSPGQPSIQNIQLPPGTFPCAVVVALLFCQRPVVAVTLFTKKHSSTCLTPEYVGSL